jgi:hypothetical protein
MNEDNHLICGAGCREQICPSKGRALSLGVVGKTNKISIAVKRKIFKEQE